MACAEVPRELRVRGEMSRGRYREAAEFAGAGGDELLRHLDRALALFYAGDTRASNLYFARAEQLAEEGYTHSLSKAALSLFLNDTVLPYQPDPWERLLVPLYRALNHVSANEPVDAAVEARRLSALLLDRRDRAPERASEEGDAFLSTLAGVLFEWAGRPEDALVAYRNAAESYGGSPAPWTGGMMKGSAAPSSGELVLLLERGFVATPIEEKVFLFLGDDDLELGHRDPEAAGRELAKRHLERRSAIDPAGHGHTYLLPIALRTRPIVYEPIARVTVDVDGRTFEAPVAFDMSRAAALSYRDELPALMAKTAARALVKAMTFKEATEEEGVVVRVLANAIHVATERADTRAWLTLPGEIRFARVTLRAGRHDLRVHWAGAGGWEVVEKPGVEIHPGQLTIVALRGP